MEGKENRRIYLDNAATTRVREEVLQEMLPYFRDNYANPSAIYTFAGEAKKAVGRAREQAAALIGAKPNEIYFTAGGSESDNWAIRAVAEGLSDKGRHIITSRIEHHAILHTCEYLERQGFEVTYLDVDSEGKVAPETLQRAIRPDTILISVMAANNEIGTIEPIAALGKIAHEKGVLFHTDAVQAYGHIPINVEEMQIDLLSASAHKFNGPKGIGFLYVREGTEIESLLHGGGQEDGMRAGTENVAGIVGMAVALKEHMETMAEDAARCETLRMQFFEALQKTSLDFIVNSGDPHIPGSVSLSFCDAEGEMLLHRLDLMGIAVSTGSACNSKETTLSHVVQAIGLPERYRKGTIRITLGIENEAQEIEKIADSISRILCR